MSKEHRPSHRNPKTGEILENKEQVCPSCFENFGTTEAGDVHRVGIFGIDRRCDSPSNVGLIGIPNAFKTIIWRLQN